jgi:hypothetical protein
MAEASGIGIGQKLFNLNKTDLSYLQGKLNLMKAKINEELAKLDDPNREATKKDIQDAASKAGVSAEALMDALEKAKRMGLLK